jgi:hypothetical protein
MRGARGSHIKPRTSREIVAEQAAERAQEIKEWLKETYARQARVRGPHATRRRDSRR